MKQKKIQKPKYYLVFKDFYLLIISACVLIFILSFYFFESSQSFNWKGIRALKKKDKSAALDYFSKAVAVDSFNPYHHLNLALAYDVNAKPDKALKIYKFIADQFSDPSSSFFAFFNRAELSGRLDLIDEALEFYQKSLEYNIEKQKVKENIEMLFNDNNNKNNNKSDSKDQKDKQQDSQNKDENNQQNSENQDQKNQQNQQSDSDDQQNDSQDNSESSQNETEPKDQKNNSLNEEQAIIEAIDKQEKEVRKKTIKGKSQFGNKGGKDW